jgi:hypothetical protein
MAGADLFLASVSLHTITHRLAESERDSTSLLCDAFSLFG